jgi:hypothetical protein
MRIPNKGQTTIKVTLSFRANGIAKKNGRSVPGAIVPKRVWAVGWAYLEKNESHKITGGQHNKTFNSFVEIPLAIQKFAGS